MSDIASATVGPLPSAVSDTDARRLVADAKHAALDDGRVLLSEMIEYVDEETARREAFAFARATQGWPVVDGRKLAAGDALLKLMRFIKDNEAEIMALAKRAKTK